MSAARTRVLVVCSESVGARMAGPAIRALELARALGLQCDVTLAAPAPSAVVDEAVTLLEAGFEDHDALLEAALRHDVVVAQQLPTGLLHRLARTQVRLVADLYNPSFMEVLEYVSDRPDREARRTQRLVERRALAHAAAADFIVCASEKQRDLWLGALGMAGLIDIDRYRADPAMRGLIDVVAFGCPSDDPPAAAKPVMKGVLPGIAAEDRVLLWGGGVWNWLDAKTAIDATRILWEARGDVHLVFLGMQRPSWDGRDEMGAPARAVAHAQEQGLEGRCVHFNQGWVPYEERGLWLQEADLGVCAHLDHLETRFSFRTRLVDCIWAALPIVCTRGDSLADVVERDGLGSTVTPEDPAAFAAACEGLLEDPVRMAAARDAIAAVRPDYHWDRVAEPLVRWCAEAGSLPPRRRRRGLVAAATLAQYPGMARETLGESGPRAMAARLARNLARSLRR